MFIESDELNQNEKKETQSSGSSNDSEYNIGTIANQENIPVSVHQWPVVYACMPRCQVTIRVIEMVIEIEDGFFWKQKIKILLEPAREQKWRRGGHYYPTITDIRANV